MRPARPKPARLPFQPRRFLLLQLRRIGDLILATPAMAALRAAFPEAEICVAAMPACASLLPALPARRAVVAGTRSAWKAIATEVWDACLDFTGSDRAALLAALSRAPLRASFQRSRQPAWHSLAFNTWVYSPAGAKHTTDHFLDLLAPLGIAPASRPLSLDLPEASEAGARRLLEANGVSTPYSVIHPGSARSEKFWEAARWAEVARRLSAWGSVVITGGNAPAELAHIRAIQAAFPAAASLAGQTSLCELAAIIRGATLFCGCDSAALHLAEAMGTPILALFGPTNPFHWQPRLTPHRILRAGGSPPWQPGTPGGSLAEIAAAEALEALEDLAASTVRISLQPSGKPGVQSL